MMSKFLVASLLLCGALAFTVVSEGQEGFLASVSEAQGTTGGGSFEQPVGVSSEPVTAKDSSPTSGDQSYDCAICCGEMLFAGCGIGSAGCAGSEEQSGEEDEEQSEKTCLMRALGEPQLDGLSSAEGAERRRWILHGSRLIRSTT